MTTVALDCGFSSSQNFAKAFRARFGTTPSAFRRSKRGTKASKGGEAVSLRVGQEFGREELLRRLVNIRYDRNDLAFERDKFRVRGDTVEIFPAYAQSSAVRVEFFGDEIDRISDGAARAAEILTAMAGVRVG